MEDFINELKRVINHIFEKLKKIIVTVFELYKKEKQKENIVKQNLINWVRENYMSFNERE